MTRSLPQLSPSIRTGLTLLALAVAALGVYQWLELVHVQHGGRAVCTLSATFDCQAVWESPAARRIHGFLGIPVAGLGIVWGVSAAFLLQVMAFRQRRSRP